MATISLVNADAMTVPLADKSVHMACCSPPYWGLRDYGLGDWQGGDPGCDHKGPALPASPRSTLKNDGRPLDMIGWRGYEQQALKEYGQVCPKCGAIRSNPGIGLEPLHDCLGWTRRGADGTGDNCGECYVCHMRMVAAEVWRVLRDDGTWWVNLGDSYAGSTQSGGSLEKRIGKTGGYKALQQSRKQNKSVRITAQNDLKPKDLCGIPWRVALALQADGWYLRSDIIWAKPNPMPESVTDRPTKAHEYVFLLSKRARYFYDAEAIKEPAQPQSIARIQQSTFDQQTGGPKDYANGTNPNRSMRQALENWAKNPTGRNRRTVWDIATQPYSGAHFATWPEALVEPMVRAGTSERGCCPVCGAQWERVVKKIGKSLPVSERHGRVGHNGQPPQISGMYWTGPTTEATDKWIPTCAHDADPIPCTILDPFAGSGTTGVVARRLGRYFVGLDLSFDYLRDQARVRLSLDALEAMKTGSGIEGGADNLGSLPLFAEIHDAY